MSIQPYLFFNGRCEEALEFYKQAIGAKVEMLMRFKECPEPGGPKPPDAEKVMHAAFKVGDTLVMASDGQCTGQTEFKGFALAVSAKTEADVDRMFAALSAGGQVTMPPGKTFFSPKFGICSDKFGVQWMLMVEP